MASASSNFSPVSPTRRTGVGLGVGSPRSCSAWLTAALTLPSTHVGSPFASGAHGGGAVGGAGGSGSSQRGSPWSSGFCARMNLSISRMWSLCALSETRDMTDLRLSMTACVDLGMHGGGGGGLGGDGVLNGGGAAGGAQGTISSLSLPTRPVSPWDSSFEIPLFLAACTAASNLPRSASGAGTGSGAIEPSASRLALTAPLATGQPSDFVMA